MKKDHRIIKNVVVGGLGQLLTMAMSLFIPRMMLVSYGSDINGLVSTVSQAFSYLLLLEYGIGAATINRLYRDIAANDQDGINLTLSATRSYFNRIIVLYALCVLGLTVAFPMFIKTSVPAGTIRMIILVQGTSGIVNFAFTNTYSMLLSADGRTYVQTLLNLMMRMISSLGQILLINNGFSVVSVQYVTLFATVVKSAATQIYVKRRYPRVKLTRGVSPELLEQKGAYFIHELCSVIFTSTDVFVIGVYCGTATASVYAIYQLVFHSLNSILNILSNGVSFKLGHLYHDDRARYIRFHDAYETGYSAIVFALMTATLYLTLPFVALYTEGVTDADYLDASLPLLFSLIQLLSCSRATCTKLISVAGHSDKTIPNTVLEAALNLGISIFLVQHIGIYGVLIGTIIALLYRSNDIMIYANRKILQRSPVRCYRTHGIYFALFFGNFLLSRRISIPVGNYGAFLLWGLVITVLMLALYGGTALLLDRSLRKTVGKAAGELIGRKIWEE